MLERVTGWYEAADRLCDAVLEGTPTQYSEHELMRAKLRDSEWDARVSDLWDRDPVTARWLLVQRAATSLAGELFGLAAEIECRANRRATGGPTLSART
jgi:hypothetical protein